jgi:hypothetical protein
MSKTPNENRESARKSDSTSAGNTKSVAGIEKVGTGKGMTFKVPNHPEHCHVSGPKGSMD